MIGGGKTVRDNIFPTISVQHDQQVISLHLALSRWAAVAQTGAGGSVCGESVLKYNPLFHLYTEWKCRLQLSLCAFSKRRADFCWGFVLYFNALLMGVGGGPSSFRHSCSADSVPLLQW